MSGHAEELFSAYLERDLPPAELRDVEVHLEGCAHCRAEYQAFTHAVSLVRDLPRVRAPRGFAQRVLKRAGQRRRQGSLRDAFASTTVSAEVAVPLLLAAAVAALVILLLP